MQQDPSGTAPQILDSTANGNHGTSIGAMTSGDQVAGKVGGANDLDGIDDAILVDDDPSLDFGTGDFSWSLWFKSAQDTSGTRVTLGHRTQTGSRPSSWMGVVGGTAVGHFEAADSNSVQAFAEGGAALNDGVWHHVAGVKEGHNPGTLKLYVDGVQAASVPTAFTGNFDVAGTNPVSIGRFQVSPYYYHQATIDEVRLAAAARSADWITTEYNNQNNPAAFTSFGAEEVQTVAVPVVVLNASPRTYTLNASQRTYVLSAGARTYTLTPEVTMGHIGYSDKQPAEVKPISVDFANQLPSGANLLSATAAAIDLSDNSDATATVLQSSAATISGTKATLKAGTDGKDYKVTVSATLDTGTPAYVLEDEFTLRVRES